MQRYASARVMRYVNDSYPYYMKKMFEHVHDYEIKIAENGTLGAILL